MAAGGDRGTVALAPLSDASRRGFCDGCEAALLRRLRSECWHIFDVWRTLSLPDTGKKTATNFLVAPHILSQLRLDIRQLTLHLLCHQTNSILDSGLFVSKKKFLVRNTHTTAASLETVILSLISFPSSLRDSLHISYFSKFTAF